MGTPATDPTTCTCDANYVPDAAQTSCVQNDLTITLSGGSTTEPWNKKRDKEHLKANLPFGAIVTDQNGQAKANVSVSIVTDVTSDTGGHVHNSGRPKGKLATTQAAIKDGASAISGVTDSTGTFSFTFGAEEASGEHKLTATCTGCKTPANATVNVAIQGLALLDAEPLSYTLRGSKDPHPGNHWFSPGAAVKIINLAHAYRNDPAFNKKLLLINDSSLIKGGVFDLGQDWTYEYNGHAGHRKGVVVDINNYRANSDPDFEIFTQKHGIQAQWHKKGTAPHYHLLLLGRDE